MNDFKLIQCSNICCIPQHRRWVKSVSEAGNVSPRCVDVALYIAINKCCSISLVTPYKSQQCQLWLCRVCGTPSNSSFIPLHANWKYHQLLLGPIIAAQKGVWTQYLAVISECKYRPVAKGWADSRAVNEISRCSEKVSTLIQRVSSPEARILVRKNNH